MKKILLALMMVFTLGIITGYTPITGEIQTAIAQEASSSDSQESSKDSKEAEKMAESEEVKAPSEAPDLGGSPEVDKLTKALTMLVEQKKGTLSIVMAVLIILVQILKSKLAKGWFGKQSRLIRRTTVVVLGVAMSIVALMMQGQDMVSALIAGLVTSGGAVTIYEVGIKPWMKDDKQKA